ncbi:MAG: hypothetical protein FH756_00480 [Firmicutes bacterium]|nr:hypothetical protein [Bacillota bacterium]
MIDGKVFHKLKRVVVKEEFVALTGDMIKAIILNQFIYWSERVQDFDKFIQEEKARAKVDDEEIKISQSNGWIYKSAEELSDETMLNLAHNTIRRHIKYLTDKGWIDQRTNPDRKWDRTTQYRVNLVKINSDLMKIGYALQDYKVELNGLDIDKSPTDTRMSEMDNALSKMYNGTSKLDNRTLQNGQAIPEITTEITTETTHKDYNIDYNPIHPSTDQDNIILEGTASDGSMEAESINDLPDIHSDTAEQQESLGAKLVIQQICQNTGANAVQVQEAIKRANRMEREGKVRSNYLKLVEAIAGSIVKEDLVKESNPTEREKREQERQDKEFFRDLYAG